MNIITKKYFFQNMCTVCTYVYNKVLVKDDGGISIWTQYPLYTRPC